MPNVYVISHQHGLLPIANRIQQQWRGLSLGVTVMRDRYAERAWRGSRLDPHRLTIEQAFDQLAIASGDALILTDMIDSARWAAPGRRILGRLATVLEPSDMVRFGFWHDGEAGPVLDHVVACQPGGFTGGQGPQVLGACTVVWPQLPVDRMPAEFLAARQQLCQMLRDVRFEGLVQFELTETMDGLQLGGFLAGWPPLHTPAFLAELDLTDLVLNREHFAPPPRVRFTTALPVTVGPWPNPGRSLRQVVGGLTAAQVGQFFWYDARFDSAAEAVITAELDGLVGVALGSAWHYELARLRALELAGQTRLAGVQFRTDVGLNVGPLLATFEQRLGVLVA